MLDGELGFPQGALYDLCVAAVKSKVEAKGGITVTYRGATERRKRLGAHKFLRLRKAVFLIEVIDAIECSHEERINLRRKP